MTLQVLLWLIGNLILAYNTFQMLQPAELCGGSLSRRKLNKDFRRHLRKTVSLKGRPYTLYIFGKNVVSNRYLGNAQM